MRRNFKFGAFSRRYRPLLEISGKGGEYRMPINQKHKKIKMKRSLFFQCKCCGKLARSLLKESCACCHELNVLIEAYGKKLEAKGLLPSLEDDDLKAYYPRT